MKADTTDDTAAAAPTTVANRTILFALAAIVILSALAWFYRDPIRQWFASATARHAAGESAHFTRVRRACTSNEPTKALNEIMRWLEVRGNGPATVTIADFLRRHADSGLAHELDELQRAAVGRTQSWSGKKLAVELARTRRQNNRFTTFDFRAKLPPLNPVRRDTSPGTDSFSVRRKA